MKYFLFRISIILFAISISVGLYGCTVEGDFKATFPLTAEIIGVDSSDCEVTIKTKAGPLEILKTYEVGCDEARLVKNGQHVDIILKFIEIMQWLRQKVI